jgi:hypothetical protein
MSDEPGTLGSDRNIELGDLCLPGSSVRPAPVGDGESLTSPRSECHDRSERTEDQEHRLLQEHRHEARSCESEQRGKHTSARGFSIWSGSGRDDRFRQPGHRRAWPADDDVSRRRQEDVGRIVPVSSGCEISRARRQHTVADLHVFAAHDRHPVLQCLAVDTNRHSSAQLAHPRTLGRDLDQQMMGLERTVVAAHGGSRSSADDVGALR